MTSAAAPAPAVLRGAITSRFSRNQIVAVFIGAFVALGLIALILVLALKPPSAHPPCTLGQPCPPPKVAHQLRGTVWKSDLGYQLEYADNWTKKSEADHGVRLESKNFDGFVTVAAERSTDYQGLFRDQLDKLKSIFNLAKSNDQARTLLGPNVGYQPGTGGVYCGNVTSSQGGTVPVDTVAMASTKDGISTFVALVSADCQKRDDNDSPLHNSDLANGDALLNTLTWPSEVP